MANNDDKILALQKQIEEKKKSINTTFRPVTNCSLLIDGTRYNIHALVTENEIMYLLIKLTSMLNAAIGLDMENKYSHEGYKLSEWITDLKAKLAVVSSKDEARKLKEMETKLTQLLSNDKKTELELASIEASLGV